VRSALVYILFNFCKHVSGARGLDPCSSAPWFEGWETPPATGPRATLRGGLRCGAPRPGSLTLDGSAMASSIQARRPMARWAQGAGTPGLLGSFDLHLQICGDGEERRARFFRSRKPTLVVENRAARSPARRTSERHSGELSE
jgi:hypothetical protein